jgi:hypothetical protein
VSCLDRNASGSVCGALFGVCMYSAGIMRDSYNAIVRFSACIMRDFAKSPYPVQGYTSKAVYRHWPTKHISP